MAAPTRLSATLAAPRAAVVTIAIPEPARPAATLHEGLTTATEHGLIGGLQDLRVDVVERNAELAEQLDAIQARVSAAMARLREEITPAREAQTAALREAVSRSLAELEESVSSQIDSTYVAHDASLVPLSARCDVTLAAERELYGETVPRMFEEACGAAVRRMERERQSFELDKTTVAAREASLLQRLEGYEAASEKRAGVEGADRVRQYNAYWADFQRAQDTIEHSARYSDARYTPAVAAAQDGLAVEAAAREAADVAFVGAMGVAIRRLQEEAMAAFGGAGGGGGGGKEEEGGAEEAYF